MVFLYICFCMKKTIETHFKEDVTYMLLRRFRAPINIHANLYALKGDYLTIIVHFDYTITHLIPLFKTICFYTIVLVCIA